MPITVCGGAIAESLGGGALNQANIDSSHRRQGLVLQAPRNWSSHGECWYDGSLHGTPLGIPLPSTSSSIPL